MSILLYGYLYGSYLPITSELSSDTKIWYTSRRDPRMLGSAPVTLLVFSIDYKQIETFQYQVRFDGLHFSKFQLQDFYEGELRSLLNLFVKLHGFHVGAQRKNLIFKSFNCFFAGDFW